MGSRRYRAAGRLEEIARSQEIYDATAALGDLETAIGLLQRAMALVRSGGGA